MARSASTSSCSTTAAPPFCERKIERQTLHCIRCAACLNTCPVYRQTGGHAYGSVYAGPIGAILTPQLDAHGACAVAALCVIAVRRLL